MSQVFFDELGLPYPDINLEVGSTSHAEQTAKVMLRFEKVVLESRPDWVVVYGDVNSTLAAALVCSKLSIPVAHVEAGLRSFDRQMPEEINRVLTDQIAELLFTPSEDGNRHLLREGISKSKIRFVGNVMIDTLMKYLPLTAKFDRGKYPTNYGLVTLHRPSNVDHLERLSRMLESLIRISHKLPLIFPVHPRTENKIYQLREIEIPVTLQLVKPMSYLEFLSLQQHATVVITDSGGIQEETTFLKVPCFTLRENTERPITVSVGTNLLLGSDLKRLEQEVDNVLAGNVKQGQIPDLWDGQAAERIAHILVHS